MHLIFTISNFPRFYENKGRHIFSMVVISVCYVNIELLLLFFVKLFFLSNMSYYSTYRWCGVPECRNTSVKTPNKLWIQVPTDINMRKTWFEVAGRDLSQLHNKSCIYYCEDHFDLEHDMENYLKYKLMGSVKRIRLKPDCVPSRFHSRKHKSDHTSDDLASKRLRISENSLQGALHIEEDIAETSSFCTEDSQTSMENKYDKAVQVAQIQEHSSTQVILIQKHKAIQARIKTQCKSKQVQTGVKTKDSVTSPIKFITSTATSPLKPNPNIKSATNPSTSNTVSRKLRFIEENCDSDTSCAPSLVRSTVDQDYSPSETSVSKATSDASLQAERKKLEKINLKSTLSKIINKPKLYIGLSKNLYFLIDLIKKHTNLTEQNILLCLMKIKLNRTFTQLGDDFDLSVTQTSNIFFNSMPEIVKVLSPFIKHFSKATIKKNLPIAFRHRYNQVTCIIDCLEIEIQKPSKAVHQALSWSEYKKIPLNIRAY